MCTASVAGPPRTAELVRVTIYNSTNTTLDIRSKSSNRNGTWTYDFDGDWRDSLKPEWVTRNTMENDINVSCDGNPNFDFGVAADITLTLRNMPITFKVQTHMNCLGQQSKHEVETPQNNGGCMVYSTKVNPNGLFDVVIACFNKNL